MAGGGIEGADILSEIKNDVDYIIVTSSKYFDEIVEQGVVQYRLERNKFIKGSVLELPGFEWKTYMDLLHRDVSVVADFCYGGILLNRLGLQFNSPFVNVRVGSAGGDEYFSLIAKCDKYMSYSPNDDKPFHIFEGDPRVEFPQLWYDDICLLGFHFKSREDFLQTWERRRKRYNGSDKRIFKVLFNEEDVEKFESLDPAIKKMGFYYKETKYDDIVCTGFSGGDALKYAYSYASFVNQECFKAGRIFMLADMFKFLNGQDQWRY